MAMRLPGGIRNDRDLYRFLLNKGDARSIIGASRYNIEGFYSPYGKEGTINTRHGYFLNDLDFSDIDLSMFSFGEAEGTELDPNHRLLLEVVREVFENAGEGDWRGKNIGTYVGLFTEDWQELAHRDDLKHSIHRILGSVDFALPNRIAYEYDLKGPSMAIKTACSSAGIALHEALEAIRGKRIISAVVTGSNLIFAPGLTINMTLLGSLSPEGSSKSFDAAADGYARGEAVSALYVKRLDEALKDGNPIRAVIRSSAINVDGKTNGISMPNGEAHEDLMRQAYDVIGLGMSKTAMVEAHGTGTKVGDPIEASAIGRCFGGEGGIYMGASKPNLGHSEAAAALTSIFKAVVSLENRIILPNIKFNEPNPKIPWDSHGLIVPIEPTVWPVNKAERIGVNSYGIGGSNVHFVIDSAASCGIKNSHLHSESNNEPRKSSKRLLLFSANHERSLDNVFEGIKDYLNQQPGRLHDVAYTLARRREHLDLRTFAIYESPSQSLEASVRIRFRGPTQVAFIFTGQGAQWASMGRLLTQEYPSFLQDIRSLNAIIHSLPHCPTWNIEDVLCTAASGKLLLEAQYSQPVCTALQIALINLLATWNIVPSAVVGHSSGELAAAYAAGALTADAAIIAAFYRGHVCKEAKKAGGMAAVGMSREDVAPYLHSGVCIACENSGSSITLSGDLDALEQTMLSIKDSNPLTLVRKLQVDMAYHSYHMGLFGQEYYELIAKHLSPTSPTVPFYSSVRGTVLRSASDFGPLYWQQNLESPVLFHSAIKSLLADSPECRVHLEVGPHPALSGPLRQIYKAAGTEINYVSVLDRGKDDTISFLTSVGLLYCHGVKIGYPHGPEKVVHDLPNYPWNYEKKYWSETRIQKNWRFRKHLPHDLLGLRIVEGCDTSPSWRNILKITNVPWLHDHRVGVDVIFPAAGYIAIAGEAIFQLSGKRDFTVQDMDISKALVLYADKAVEMVTSFHTEKPISAVGSRWFSFQVATYDGTTWNEHCSGRVCGGCSSPLPQKAPSILDRKVSSSRWYTAMARVGLNYAGKFARLKNIAASVTDQVASVDVLDEQERHESAYMLHPSTLDLVFQSLTVAKAKGTYRNFDTLFLPTHIEELYVGDGARKSIRIKSSAATRGDTFTGNSYGVTDGGDIVYVLKGFRGKAMRALDSKEPPDLHTLRLQWKPHPDFLPAGDLMHITSNVRDLIQSCERLMVLCAIETRHAIASLTPAQPHLAKFRSWINAQYERYQKPDYPLVEDSMALVQMSPSRRQQVIEENFRQCEAAGAWAYSNAIYRTYKNAVSVFEGKTSFLDILLEDGVLTGIHNWYNDIREIKEYVQLHGNANPQLRILEIGAGTGGITAKFLEHLRSDYGERLYWRYTFTDISSGFFIAAKERFKHYEGIQYQVLDISKDPRKQGFVAGGYDIIVASNVLHATPCLQDTLTNVRSLLKPNGQLFLQELCPVTQMMSYVMGPVAGWWLAEEDGRVQSPFISPEEWDKRLRSAGFSGCKSVTLDYEPPYVLMANSVAKPAIRELAQHRLTLLRPTVEVPLVVELVTLLRKRNIEFDICILGETLPANQDIISLIDLGEKPVLQDVNEEDLSELLKLVQKMQTRSLVWLMPAAQINPANPSTGMILGLMRTARSELAASFATLELGDGVGAAQAAVHVLDTIRRSKIEDGELDVDMEWIWYSGTLNVGRFHWIPVEKDLCDTVESQPVKALQIRTPGFLETLQWTSQALEDPAKDEIHIKVSMVGLNQSDLQLAMGIDISARTNRFFGVEAVGYVVKLGSSVTELALGDRVMTVGGESTGIATIIARAAELCVKIPHGLSDEEAATMPFAYTTVLLFLVEKWKLQRGQSILIHAATEGIGICAIQVARWIGADIFAAVDSEEKISFLVETFNLPRGRIFDLRDGTFPADILEATSNNGVDVVLHTSPNEHLQDSWRCVAEDGVMIDIGKRDTLVGRGRLLLTPFERDRTFIVGDATRLITTNKSRTARLLRLALDKYATGSFGPVRPITKFDAQNIAAAFKHFQAGSGIGKVVIMFPDEHRIRSTPSVPTPRFRKDATYVLVGGLGGLGKAIASWMVEHGAQHLMFLSRSAGESLEDQGFLRELEAMNCSPQVFSVDVADATAMKQVIALAAMPIAGAMHMAMVLADAGIIDMDLRTWQKAVNPKVQGAWNLHNLLPRELDFFILFSSLGGIHGYYGQSNYSAGNTFLDSFSQYRQSLGLPASVISIGPIDDIGFVSRTASVRENLRQSFASLLTEKHFLDTLHLAICRSSITHGPRSWPNTSPYSGFQAFNHIFHSTESTTPIMDNDNATFWKRDPRMSIYRNLQRVPMAENKTRSSQLDRFLSIMAKDPSKLDDRSSAKTIAEELGKYITNLLMRGSEMELSQSLATASIDSLVAIEIRNWWKRKLGIEISVLELLSGGSIEQLGVVAAQRLKTKFSK
ncbi:putative polyketide synthase [Pseudovirgaria hyperparasitica]|uniref:Putative polyketide synthase n=1 Tax=Pseudovirgaria hyperparasitica TaxID=470096 RepID=A0A6A6WK19_9PEZI|nr:putative polyketide synthase [Pseudovirgaria hyperparasitica]KAF2762537.1 putative polyketide synthase [Pseudovirgaria hyperparasitica]